MLLRNAGGQVTLLQNTLEEPQEAAETIAGQLEVRSFKWIGHTIVVYKEARNQNIEIFQYDLQNSKKRSVDDGCWTQYFFLRH